MTPSFKNALHTGALLVSLAIGATLPMQAQALDLASPDHVAFKTTSIAGIDIAYREAGDPSYPTVLLLHGFPTSSHMFRNLIPELAQKYHVIAPDYPGFGASAMPLAEEFEYSFANIARMMSTLLDQKGVERYVAYVMDYGAPVGYRMFAEDPERVAGFVIQNGNAYTEGLREFWDPIKAYWAAPTVENGDALRGFFALEATKWQFTAGVQNPENISPDNLLDRAIPSGSPRQSRGAA
ncbi:Pimeloyl-ACP methyl ester carboxylesterase [Roseovarius lutimaris]|uniref:Pimeloyl-ACP methyl ester carboxylesterase n=1 Tax=Roseovarius lutimaris TaxID=1005928 RepID=A0A1I5CLS9_9RHOB|nr:alpha/beta hydrolase [Roseovarius lutimaris]SFN87928.1 Pimeloyl-ACP methyl ester carboxylesterase [Roseovarius lutimaris]